MDHSLPVRRGHTGADRTHDLQRALWRETSFFSQEIVQRSTLNEIHHQVRHAADHAEVCYVDNIPVADACCYHRFLTEARGQHGIITYQVRQDYFDGVGSLEKDMLGFVNNAHRAPA